jgi:hypothetical protein
MIEACTGPTIGMSGAMAAEGGGGGVVGFVQRHLPLRGEASWGGDPPTPPPLPPGALRGLLRKAPCGAMESGAAEARAAERTGARRADDASGSGRGKVAERWRGGVI